MAVGSSIMFWLLQRNRRYRRPTTPAKTVPIPEWPVFSVGRSLNEVDSAIRIGELWRNGYTPPVKLESTGLYCRVWYLHSIGGLTHIPPSDFVALNSHLIDRFGDKVVGPIVWTKERP